MICQIFSKISMKYYTSSYFDITLYIFIKINTLQNKKNNIDITPTIPSVYITRSHHLHEKRFFPPSTPTYHFLKPFRSSPCSSVIFLHLLHLIVAPQNQACLSLDEAKPLLACSELGGLVETRRLTASSDPLCKFLCSLS